MISTRELIEQASMYVLGLLDDDERQDFERAYEQAPAPLQAQLRREMLRCSEMDAVLPSVQPPPGLRRTVLDAIAALGDAEARQRVAQRFGPFSLALQRNVSPLWRAACIAFIAGTLVLGYSFHRVSEQFQSVRMADAEASILSAVLQDYGTRFLESLLSEDVTVMAFTATAAAGGKPVQATLIVDNRDEGATHLLCRGLPAVEGGYRLVVLEDDGRIGSTLLTFDSIGARNVIPVSASIPSGTRLAVVPYVANSSDAAILVSRVA